MVRSVTLFVILSEDVSSWRARTRAVCTYADVASLQKVQKSEGATAAIRVLTEAEQRSQSSGKANQTLYMEIDSDSIFFSM